MFSLVFWYGAHKICNLSLDSLHQAIFKRLFLGVPLYKVQQEVDEFLLHLPRFLYYPAVSRLEEDSLLISSSPDFLVGPICHILNIKEWKASSYEIDKEGKLCHISKIVEGKTKAALLAEVAEKKQLQKENLVYYTDSILDLPVLEIAGSFVAVRPDRKLKKLAKIRQWEIIDEPSFCSPLRNR